MSAKELNDHFIQLRSRAVLDKPTRTIGKLTAQGVGREYLPSALWSKTGLYSVQDKMVKRMLPTPFPLVLGFTSWASLRMGSANSALKANSTLCFIGNVKAPGFMMQGQRFTMTSGQRFQRLCAPTSPSILAGNSLRRPPSKTSSQVCNISQAMHSCSTNAQRTPDGVFFWGRTWSNMFWWACMHT